MKKSNTAQRDILKSIVALLLANISNEAARGQLVMARACSTGTLIRNHVLEKIDGTWKSKSTTFSLLDARVQWGTNVMPVATGSLRGGLSCTTGTVTKVGGITLCVFERKDGKKKFVMTEKALRTFDHFEMVEVEELLNLVDRRVLSVSKPWANSKVVAASAAKH